MSRWGCVLVIPVYQVNDPRPDGYLEWHEWAKVQHQGGLRQARCGGCQLWLFPQERKAHVCDES